VLGIVSGVHKGAVDVFQKEIVKVLIIITLFKLVVLAVILIVLITILVGGERVVSRLGEHPSTRP
jgi:hypothetical protein